MHINKLGVAACLSAERDLRLSGTDLHRFAAVHHTGETTTSGHYTATVATQASAFHCDDLNVTEQPHLFTDAWSNAFLILYRNNDADVLHQCGGSHPAPRSVVIVGDKDSEHEDEDEGDEDEDEDEGDEDEDEDADH